MSASRLAVHIVEEVKDHFKSLQGVLGHLRRGYIQL